MSQINFDKHELMELFLMDCFPTGKFEIKSMLFQKVAQALFDAANREEIDTLAKQFSLTLEETDELLLLVQRYKIQKLRAGIQEAEKIIAQVETQFETETRRKDRIKLWVDAVKAEKNKLEEKKNNELI
jgi:septal ring factor EnvC (AmiA/AmiB activator)